MKIKSFRIKKCTDCFYWQSFERINQKELCAWHRDKEEQPPAILKEIKQQKKERRNQIMLYLLIFILACIPFCLAFIAHFYFFELDALPHGYLFRILSSFVLTSLTFRFFDSISSFNKLMKEFREEIKKLNLKKQEWIIEYEQ